MTNAALQDHMQKMIKADTLGPATLQEVDLTMSRIWTQARTCLHEQAQAVSAVVAGAAETTVVTVAKAVA